MGDDSGSRLGKITPLGANSLSALWSLPQLTTQTTQTTQHRESTMGGSLNISPAKLMITMRRNPLAGVLPPHPPLAPAFQGLPDTWGTQHSDAVKGRAP